MKNFCSEIFIITLNKIRDIAISYTNKNTNKKILNKI